MRAKPLIVWGLLAGIAVLPASALALGLGKLTVDSNLGQPLSARIELTAAQKDELDSLAAKVADQSVYRDNNVTYSAALGRARVTVEQSPNNAPYLTVTTTQAVNEPFLNLIVEVNWATGRIVRNYTFLLDPPGVGETQAVEPVTPIRAQAPAPARRRAEETAVAPSSGEANSYTVHHGDTLSKIAKEYKPENVSLEQMLVALFRSNESAFDGKNMNRLRSGQILTIPPADEAAATTPVEAMKVVHVQAADWRAYRERVAAAAPMTEAAEGGQTAGGKITTAVQDQGQAAQPGKDQLRVSRESGKGAASGAALAEELAAKDKALAEANSRIAQLETTLKDMQKRAAITNQPMADLQKQAEANQGAKAPEAPKTEPAKITTAPATPRLLQRPRRQRKRRPPSLRHRAHRLRKLRLRKLQRRKPAPGKRRLRKPRHPKRARPRPRHRRRKSRRVVAKAAKAPAAPESSFLGQLIDDTPTWALGAGGLGIVALFAGLFAARRRKTTKFEDSIISGTDIKTNTVFGSTGGGVVNTGDNSLASDFSREGLGSIDTDEVDPIAEAEVYLAYGRDAQAEEILKEALKKDPQRQEIYLKLLEIHAQHNKPSAFETVASELYSVSGGQGEVWQKAMALGRQLDPNNPLFAEVGGAAAFAAAAAAEGEHRRSDRRGRAGTAGRRAGDTDSGGSDCRADGREGHRFHARRRHIARADFGTRGGG